MQKNVVYKNKKTMRNFVEINNPGRGNCFFYAVVIGMHYALTKNYPTNSEVKQAGKELRKQVVNGMRNRAERDANFRMGIMAAEFDVRNNMGHKRNNNNKNNVSVMTNAYFNRMKRDCVWGGHAEAETTHQMLKDMGFKGLIVYEERNGKYTRVVEMTGKLNMRKKLPVIRVLLHGVDNGGVHFTTLV